jgi:hypothetical protein
VKERQPFTTRPLQQSVAGAIMTSPPKSPTEPLPARNGRIEAPSDDVTTAQPSGSRPPRPRTPEAQREDRENAPLTPSSPEAPPSFDWTDFEQRYEEALQEADLREKDILKEADLLAQVRISSLRAEVNLTRMKNSISVNGRQLHPPTMMNELQSASRHGEDLSIFPRTD